MARPAISGALRRKVMEEAQYRCGYCLTSLGLTPCGRATVVALKLNNESLTRARRRWVLAGWHPPPG